MGEPTLTGLRLCQEIARLGSFSAAARVLGYSQPAVSRHVAAVEAAVGYPLFVRQAGGVRVTPAGAVVAQHAARILGGLDAMSRELHGLGDRLAGRVGLGAFPAAAAALIPAALAQLAREHPGLMVSLTEAATPALLREVRSGRLDVVVIGVGAGLSDYDLDGLVRRRIDAGELCVAMPAGHRLAAAEPIPVRDLTMEPWIVGTGSPGDPQFGAWPTLVDPVVHHRVRDWPARLGLVSAGLGLCVLPEMAAPSVPAGVVTRRVDDPNWLGRATLVVTQPSAPTAAAAVVDALTTAAQDIRSR
ncbi:LysR family transcriptional regulator [Mycolicibacterium sp. 018/SC-01/001]|uniref:LysR family transcriptional regulator n=1 Tax=Mycolicibacterium sp. 018/SC-01/001 TaxID=2592069 RepID=UPI00117CA5DE|nr:LysR family transcriptional regulator [Mycolicibacterium sp. 018/SC-01/001]TRW89140.1 LysR family transcriptional regulator [Mycolicibacterium sp. 018/SC-01/001]